MSQKLILLLILILPVSLHCQETKSKEGFYFGLNFGGYLGNSNNASYYRADPTSDYSIDWALASAYYVNGVQYADLKDYLVLEVIGDDFTIKEYATNNMKYKFSYVIGGHLGYNISDNLGILAEVAYSDLSAEGSFIIETTSAPIGNKDNTQLGYIGAEESRFNIDLGIRYLLTNKFKVNPYLEGGFNINIVEVKKHEMELAGVTRSLLVSNTYNSTGKIGGGGIGYWGGAGIQFDLNDRFYCQIGLKINMQQTALETKDYYPNESFFIRFLL